MAHRALGFAAAAHAELAKPAARLSYRGDDPDGYRTLPEVVDFIAGYAKLVAAPVRTHTTVKSVRSTETGYLVCTDQGDWRCRTRRALLPGACNIARCSSLRRSGALGDRATDRPAIPQSRVRLADGGVAGRRRIRRAARRSPTKSSARAVRSRCRSASISARRASTAARTSNGGWTPRACSTSATTRSTTSAARGACRRCSLPARPIDDARSQCAHHHRREAGRPRRRHHRRRQSAIRRIAAQYVRDVRSQNAPAAGRLRRVGARERHR